MRYELDTNGYVSVVVFGCLTGNCIEYTGEVPSGYTDLADWASNACIEAYYIDGGNLVLDSEKQAECIAKQDQEDIDNKPVLYKDLHEATSLFDNQYKTADVSGKVINIENAVSLAPIMKITNVHDGKLDIYANGKQLIRNDAATETTSGITFTKQMDGSIKLNGTSTEAIDYNLSGSSTNSVPICAIKDNIDYYLNIGGYQCEMKYFDGETTSQVYEGDSGLINLSENKAVTQFILKIPSGTTIDNVEINPTFNLGTSAITPEDYKVRRLSTEFNELCGEGLYPSNDLFPSDTLFPYGDSIDYILIQDGKIIACKNGEIIFLKAGNVNIFNGENIIYTLQNTTIEMTYSTNSLNVEDLDFLCGKGTSNQKFKILDDASIQVNDIYLYSGAKVIGGDGLLTNLQYQSTGQYDGYNLLGFDYDLNSNVNKSDVSVSFTIPDNFTIKEAYATIVHTPVQFWDFNNASQIGRSRNIGLYHGTNTASILTMGYVSGYILNSSNLTGQIIPNAFSGGNFTSNNSIPGTIDTSKSMDISGYLLSGLNTLFLRTSETTTSDISNSTDACQKTGRAKLIIDIIGYMNYEEEGD